MGLTNLDTLNARTSRVKVVALLPVTPAEYYENASNDVTTTEWQGGETAFLTTQNRLYIQTATSGTTPTWKRLLTQFATTTSTSSSTSSSSSTSTSTSTSTSSSSTSTSTSTSSTTTMA